MICRQSKLGGVLLACVALTGCQKLAMVKVQPAMATLEGSGKTAQFQASQLDTDGKEMKKTAQLAWASDNPTVATVESNGTVTAKKTGRATITASAGAAKGQAMVDVHISAKIIGQDLTLGGSGQTQQVTFLVADENGLTMPTLSQAIKVAVADPKVATVASAQGKGWTVTAVGEGQTKLTASVDALSQQFALTVKPPEVSELKVSQAELKLKPGATQKVGATAMAGDKPLPIELIKYTSSDPKIATVDADGTVHAVGKGKATISAAAGQKSATVTVLVKK